MNDVFTAQCEICPHECEISEGNLGFCTARKNVGGKIISDTYGKITALALDPIEKKPLYMFHPGKMILSVGSYGCNLRCEFCQNVEIAVPHGSISINEITPEELLRLAKETVSRGNIGVAYTYNEPLINFEFLHDTARIIAENGMKNIVVTNGFINPEPLKKILPYIHAMNIDLKGFTHEFYKKIGGELDAVKNTILLAQEKCHVEITTLLIPDENENDIEPIAKWISSINTDIPLHISRFFPRHLYSNREPTPRELIHKSAETARKYLKNVFVGNM
jgi:pyruvate formate lyase activating enzyme